MKVKKLDGMTAKELDEFKNSLNVLEIYVDEFEITCSKHYAPILFISIELTSYKKIKIRFDTTEFSEIEDMSKLLLFLTSNTIKGREENDSEDEDEDEDENENESNHEFDDTDE